MTDFSLYQWTTSTPLTAGQWFLDSQGLELDAVAWCNVRTNIPRANITTLRAGLGIDASNPPLVFDLDPVLRTIPLVGLAGTDDYETSFIAGRSGPAGALLYLPPCVLKMCFFIDGAAIAATSSLTMTIVARRRGDRC